MAKSKIDRVANALTRATFTQSPGVTVSQLAKAARVDKDTVYKRVHDLRAEGMKIYTNFRTVNGERKTYYRAAV